MIVGSSIGSADSETATGSLIICSVSSGGDWVEELVNLWQDTAKEQSKKANRNEIIFL
jgi:hypothetical protein